MAEALSAEQVDQRLGELKGWQRKGAAIEKSFDFPDYHHTMAFVNAVAWVAHRADHHPDLTVGYNKVVVRYSTHSAGGVTEKDLLSAEQIEALLTS